MLERLFRILSVVLPLAGMMLCSSPVRAMALGVTPGRLDFNLSPGTTCVETMVVFNQDIDAAEFEVYPEGGIGRWFTIKPDRFTLQGLEQKTVEIRVSPPLTAATQDYELLLCVVSRPQDSDLRIGAGVKIPVRVQVIRGLPGDIRWWTGGIFFLALITTILLFRQRRKSRHV